MATHERSDVLDIFKGIEKTERARFRRQIERAQAKIWGRLALARGGLVEIPEVRRVVRETFDEMRNRVSPRKRKKG